MDPADDARRAGVKDAGEIKRTARARFATAHQLILRISQADRYEAAKVRDAARSDAAAVRNDALAEARAAYQAARGEVDAAEAKTRAAVRSAHAADRGYLRLVDTLVCPPRQS